MSVTSPMPLDPELGARRALQSLRRCFPQAPPLSTGDCRPWGSYATFRLWHWAASTEEKN